MYHKFYTSDGGLIWRLKDRACIRESSKF